MVFGCMLEEITNHLLLSVANFHCPCAGDPIPTAANGDTSQLLPLATPSHLSLSGRVDGRQDLGGGGSGAALDLERQELSNDDKSTDLGNGGGWTELSGGNRARS